MNSLTLNGYVLKCNCADFQHKLAANPSRSNLSELADRNWTSSGAALYQKLCKHLWAIVIYEKLLEEFPIPSDVATLPAPKRAIREEYRLQRNKLRGDDFSDVAPKSSAQPWII